MGDNWTVHDRARMAPFTSLSCTTRQRGACSVSVSVDGLLTLSSPRSIGGVRLRAGGGYSSDVACPAGESTRASIWNACATSCASSARGA